MVSETKTAHRLVMAEPGALNPRWADVPDLRVELMKTKCPEFNRFLYLVVGHGHLWGWRDTWGRDGWCEYVNRDELETWVAYVAGTPAGYFELEKLKDGEAHIMIFGLLPQFIGQGLGGHLLTRAVERAWELGPSRVIVGTCSHDHPHALNNYLARGFEIVEEKQEPANPPVRTFWELVDG